ncbi:hydrogenase expression/formation protein HypE [Halobacteriovorax sp. GFR7]|uniref:hydrogenase expression/formation protein HypE n=1 Tax=unclassified Halobacteriovorax TaxID=2639665 RepID=UPI003D98BAD0
MTKCPLTKTHHTHIQQAHGGGGKLMDQLINEMFKPYFGITDEHDGAFIPVSNHEIVMTTDSFVVNPLFFPGGDIGKLAIYGTVNDLAVSGAIPKYLSLSFILEEGFELSSLDKICHSISQAAKECNIRIVTGDTKVIEQSGRGGIFINTTGIGYCEKRLTPNHIRNGDAVIISGDIGRHAMAIMAQRENLSFEPPIESDCMNLYPVINALIKNKIDLHCARDLTRGGLASSLNELSESAQLSIQVQKELFPIHSHVESACELLGLSPENMACEGAFVAFISPEHTQKAIEILKANGMDRACMIGKVKEAPGPVTMINDLGAELILDRPFGDQLPRIC